MKAHHAEEIIGSTSLPRDIRMLALERFAKIYGQAALLELFADFIGMANRVIENTREAIELNLIIDHGWHPNTAEKVNLPTIFGALFGVSLAKGIDQDKLCAGCAFRIGTVANQCPSTTIDADWCAHPGERPFMCHEDLDEAGNPTRGCAGFAQKRRMRSAG